MPLTRRSQLSVSVNVTRRLLPSVTRRLGVTHLRSVTRGVTRLAVVSHLDLLLNLDLLLDLHLLFSAVCVACCECAQPLVRLILFGPTCSRTCRLQHCQAGPTNFALTLHSTP